MGEVGDERGMVNDVEGVRNLGGRKMLSGIRDGISVFVVVVMVLTVWWKWRC